MRVPGIPLVLIRSTTLDRPLSRGMTGRFYAPGARRVVCASTRCGRYFHC